MSGTSPAYTAVMIGAVLTGILARRLTAEPSSLRWWQRAAVAAGAIVGGAFGAKLPFVLTDVEGLVSGSAWLADGRTLLYALVFGYFGVELAKLGAGVREKTGDGFAVPVAAGVAVGRIGCFVAGCCYGAETDLPWGVDFGDGIARHPTQLYEAGFHALAATALYVAGRRGLVKHQRIKLYILGYCAYRFATEFLRPEPLHFGLTFYQWSALAAAPVFVALFLWDARKQAGSSARPELTARRSRSRRCGR